MSSTAYFFLHILAHQVLMYRHDKTGAQLMSVINSDENKTFGVTFRCAMARWLGA